MSIKLDYIDTCRGLAILMVILVHCAQRVPNLHGPMSWIAAYGQMGVQLFFIASSYTLCASWFSKKSNNFQTRNFIIRRFFRIAPLYYIGIIIYAITSALESLYKGNGWNFSADYNAINIISNIFFVHGFYPPANNSVVPGGWSIGTEVAFYVIFPFVIKFFENKNYSFSQSVFYVIAYAFFIHALLFIVYVFTGEIVQNNNFLYFNIITQSQVFFVGILFFKLNSQKVFQKTSPLKIILFFIVMSSLTILMWTSSNDYLFSIIPLTASVSFICIFLLLENFQFLNFLIIRKIGVYSYSIYIIHSLFAHKMGSILSPLLSKHLPADVVLMIIFIVAIAFSFVFSVFSYRYIESYFISMGNHYIKR